MIKDPEWLLLSDVWIGIAWASILAMLYAILASSPPQRKLGIYMASVTAAAVARRLRIANSRVRY